MKKAMRKCGAMLLALVLTAAFAPAVAQVAYAGPATYPVVISSKLEHGTVKADKMQAASGETVTVTAIPDKGYKLDIIEVSDEGDAAILNADESPATFKMPATVLGKVNVQAIFYKPGVYYVVTAGALNIREFPFTSSARVGGLSKGDVVERMTPDGADAGGWFRINYNGKKGWVDGKYLALKVTPAVSLSASEYTWDNGVKKPSVAVKAGGKALTASDYNVAYAAGCKNVGKYAVTVTLKGSYSGSKTVYFKINPKGTNIKKLTKASKAVTVKWAKQPKKMSSSRITGYEIQLATNSKFTKNKKTVSVKGYGKTSKKVKKLKGNKKYYVQVRTYKTVDGEKYYSAWSKAKSVKTKK